MAQRRQPTDRFSLGFSLGRPGARAETDAELHQAGGEGRLRAGVHAGIPGGSPRVPPHVQSARKCRSGSLCARQPREDSTSDWMCFLCVQYAGINIGPVHKKDVMKASTMLEHDPQ